MITDFKIFEQNELLFTELMDEPNLLTIDSFKEDINFAKILKKHIFKYNQIISYEINKREIFLRNKNSNDFLKSIKMIVEYDKTLINVQDIIGRTALHYLSFYPTIKNLNLILYLDENGGDWTIKNNIGLTPIETLQSTTKEHLKEKYPKLWKKISLIKNMDDFNI